jgi:hypothetical protein
MLLHSLDHCSQRGSNNALVDFTQVACVLHAVMRTLLPQTGYGEALTNLQLWLHGALISYREFDIVGFMICEIEDTILDGI